MTKPFGSVGRTSVGGAVLATVIGLGAIQSAQAQKVLFHGADPGPTAGDDGAVFDYLQSLLGPENVTYLQDVQALPDAGSAAGFDAVITSSTSSSGDVLSTTGGYADVSIGWLNWEQALTRDDRVGEQHLALGGGTTTDQTQIEIADPAHPLAGGLSGTVTVFNTPRTFSYGTDDVGAGVDIVANRAGDSNDHVIMAAERGAALVGDGTPGKPDTAPGPRVMFFLEDVGFADLTLEGRMLFNNSLQFVLERDEPFPVTISGPGIIGREELPLKGVELETTQDATSVPGLTMDVYKNVNLGSQGEWALHLAGLPTPAASGAVPWINWDEVPVSAAEFGSPDSYADAQPILDADLTNAGDAAAPDFENYSVRMTGEILIPENTVRFKDGNDDYTYLAIDLDGNDQIDAAEVLVNDNAWAPWNGADAVDGDPASPIVTADFSGSLTGDDAWRKIEFRMAEGGGGDNAALFWDQNPAGFFPDDPTFALSTFELVPQDSFRTFQEELVGATIVSSFAGSAVFDVFVEQLDWDRISMPGAAGGRLELDGAEFQINVLDPENLTTGLTIDLVRDENIAEISGTPTFVFLNTDEADWDTSMFSENGQITFGGGVDVGIPGDYSGNGLVEQADLDLVLGNWGQNADNLPANWVNDPATGFVDQNELDKVLSNWGASAGLGAAAGVPEPSTIAIALLVVVACLGLSGWRKR